MIRRRACMIGFPVRLGLLLAAAACAIVAGASGATATTSPDGSLRLKAVMTNSGIVIVHTKSDSDFVRVGGRTAAFPRGLVVDFSVYNAGTKSLVPALHVLNTANADPYDHPLKYYTSNSAAPPGGRVTLQVSFYFRAPYELLELNHGKPTGKSVSIDVH